MPIIEKQREGLVARLERPMERLARMCAAVWGEPDALDRALTRGVHAIPLCSLLYAVDTSGIQVSANITCHGANPYRRGQSLAGRPFMDEVLPCSGFLLSRVYVSRATRRPCVTAVQVVADGSGVLGFVAADFDLRDLSLPEEKTERAKPAWRQIRGDPAIRETLFLQRRVASPMDARIDDVIAICEELICERGVFHGKLHFSSSRATLWMTDDPYRYRVHVLDEIIDPAVCLAYPRRAYPEQASVRASLVRPVFEQFRMLREADETIYLRSASLNVINGMVNLTFSCDGSHYMPAEEFLSKEETFWFGPALENRG